MRRSSRSSTATSCGSASASGRRSSGTTTAKRVERSQARRGSPAGSPPSAAATSPTRARARFRSMPRRGRAVASSPSPVSIRAAVFGPIPAHAVEPSGRCRLAQLRERADPERVAELAHPLRREPEQARHADELRQRLRLELLQLRQLARLDELAQPLPRSRGRSRRARGRARRGRAPRRPPACERISSAARR